MEVKKYYATGRRKTSVARVWIWPGEGKLIVNKQPLEGYFTLETWRTDILKPFEVTATSGKFDVYSTVKGGGITGQKGALRHGLARALEQVDGSYRAALKKAGLLTRDPRMKERKKYGQPGARKRFQFSKR
ncbi:MAG: 30S ribosomal protein S9 [Candidatus Coatesbacteria bacterium]|nr:MAG: 30S ribosomal protein S9 [Candidatus Coatesbacteria bacterium]